MRNSVDIIHFHRIERMHARTHPAINCCRCADLSIWSMRSFEQHRLPISFFAFFVVQMFSFFFSLQDQKKRLYHTMQCNLMHLCADFKMFKCITHNKNESQIMHSTLCVRTVLTHIRSNSILYSIVYIYLYLYEYIFAVQPWSYWLLWLLFIKSSEYHIKTILVCKIIIKKKQQRHICQFKRSASNGTALHTRFVFFYLLRVPHLSIGWCYYCYFFDALAKLDCTLNTRIAQYSFAQHLTRTIFYAIQVLWLILLNTICQYNIQMAKIYKRAKKITLTAHTYAYITRIRKEKS